MTGTWRIDDFLAASQKPDSPLHEGYTTRVYPSLFSNQSVWTDNHTWVLPKGTPAAQHKAALVFLKFSGTTISSGRAAADIFRRGSR